MTFVSFLCRFSLDDLAIPECVGLAVAEVERVREGEALGRTEASVAAAAAAADPEAAAEAADEAAAGIGEGVPAEEAGGVEQG